MRLSVGPIIVGKIDSDVEGDCVWLLFETYEQFGLDSRTQLLVLGSGERRACCSCDFEDKRTLFLKKNKV